MDRPRLSWLSCLFPGPLVIALAYFLLHLMTSRYRYFRDALYYLACSEHLDWGYVDHPPLIALIGWVTRYTLGASLPALIFWPALAGAGRILLSAALARALGAQHFGIAFVAIVTSLVPVWFATDHQFAMNAFEPLFWLGCALVLVRMIQTENPKLWIAFGILAGLGTENKYSMAVFAFALLAGILVIKLDEGASQPGSCDQGPARVMAYRRHTSYPARGSPGTSCGQFSPLSKAIADRRPTYRDGPCSGAPSLALRR